MQPSRLFLPIVLAFALSACLAASAGASVGGGGVPVMVTLRWDGYRDTGTLVQTDAGPRYDLIRNDGTPERLTPDEFAARSLQSQTVRAPLERLFNVSGAIGIAWVLFGLAGQVVFTGRMVVQWLISERRKESVVPPIFWWLSLGGSAMLLCYFLWRQDIVGILGQSLGLGIYVRNLVLIRNTARKHLAVDPEASPA